MSQDAGRDAGFLQRVTQETLGRVAVAILGAAAIALALVAVRAGESRLDRVIWQPDLSSPAVDGRMRKAMVKALHSDDPSRWTEIIPADATAMRQDEAEMAAFIDLNMPQPGTMVGGRNLKAIQPLADGAWLTFAAQGHLRLTFDDGPDLWVQIFDTDAVGMDWPRHVLLTQGFSGGPRRAAPIGIREDGRQVICVEDGDRRPRTVCAMPLAVNRMVLSVAGRAAKAGDEARSAERRRLAGLLVAAAPDIRPPGAPTPSSEPTAASQRLSGWKAELSEVMPKSGWRRDGLEVAQVVYLDRTAAAPGFRGLARIDLKGGEGIEVALLQKPRPVTAANSRLLLPDAVALSGWPEGDYPSAVGVTAQLPFACLSRTTQAQTSEMVCIVSDPGLPVIWVTRGGVVGPASSRKAAMELLTRRALTARALMFDALEP